MTADEIKTMRQSVGLSVSEAARSVQVAERTWRWYESGKREIPGGVVELFCLKHGIKYP